MMNEKDMQNIAIAAQYGNCGTKYLGEILDQLRIQGLDKQDMRWLCHTLATESPNIVRRLNANMNEDQFQRWMNCMHEHAENDPYMEALEYAFTVYGSNAGICKGPDAGKKETIHTHLFQSVQDHRLPLTDFVELTETYHAFWDVFRLEMESFLENLRPLDSEKDAKTAKSIIALVTDCQCTSKNKKLAAMKALRNHNVTPGSKNAEKLAIYFSEREIRYLNVILAQGKVSDAVMDKISAEFVENLLKSGNDENMPYTLAEQNMLAHVCNRKFVKRIDGYSSMRAFFQSNYNLCRTYGLTNANWMVLYQKIVLKAYQSSFCGFNKLLTFDCSDPTTWERLVALPDEDVITVVYRTTSATMHSAKEHPEQMKELLSKIMDVIVWLLKKQGTTVDEKSKLEGCIKYTRAYATKFIQAGLVTLGNQADLDKYWEIPQGLRDLDTWTIRMLLKRLGKSLILADCIDQSQIELNPWDDTADFFTAVYPDANPDRFTQEERVRLFTMFAEMRFRYNLNTLSSMYTYMLRNQIPFEKFMDSETEKVLAKLLLNNPEFSKYEETLRSMVMTKEEFETYQVMAANETLAQEQVKELLSVQELMKKHVRDLVHNPDQFLEDCRFIPDNKKRIWETTISFLKMTKVHFGESNESLLDDTFRTSMQAAGHSLYKYSERMSRIARNMKDPYFLKVMAKHVLQETENQGNGESETEDSKL